MYTKFAPFCMCMVMALTGCVPSGRHAPGLDALEIQVGEFSGDRYHVGFVVEISRPGPELFGRPVELSCSLVDSEGRSLPGGLHTSGSAAADTLRLEGQVESFHSLAGQEILLVLEDLSTGDERFHGRWQKRITLPVEDSSVKLLIDPAAPAEGADFALEEASVSPHSVYLMLAGSSAEEARVLDKNAVALYMQDGSLIPCYGGSARGSEAGGRFQCQVIRLPRHPVPVGQVAGVLVDGVAFPVQPV